MKNALGKNAMKGPSKTPIMSGPVASLEQSVPQRGNVGDMRSGMETALNQHADTLHPRKRNVVPTSPDRAPDTKY